jgi:hypothetical protein
LSEFVEEGGALDAADDGGKALSARRFFAREIRTDNGSSRFSLAAVGEVAIDGTLEIEVAIECCEVGKSVGGIAIGLSSSLLQTPSAIGPMHR